MANTLTLQELKARNAEAEKAEASAADNDENATEDQEVDESPQDSEIDGETGTVENEQEETDEDAETSEEESGENDTEDWMQSDSHESQAEKKYTGSDIGAAKAKVRAKLNAKLEEKDSENERLKAELEALKRGPVAESLVRPKREDFIEADDPDVAYEDALLEWRDKTFEAKLQASQATEATTRQQQEQVSAISKAVDQHYVKAVELAEQSGISADAYQASDLKVRQTVESIYPQAGDAVTDGLIANLGDGSEKVFYNLGVNSARREEFARLLNEDKTGIKAAIYLGSLKEQLLKPTRRKSNAPPPADDVTGDKQGNSQSRALKSRYDKAHKSGDTQAAFNAKREAKKAGVDVTNW